MRRAAEIGLMDETHFAYLEDIDIGYRARIHGYVNLYIPEAVVFHAGSGASGSRHNAFKASLASRNSIYLIYKNMPLLQILINLPFLTAGYMVKTVFFVRKGLGAAYLKGLRQGFALCGSERAGSKRIRFRRENLCHYFRIQLELWCNLWRRLEECRRG